MKKIMIINRGEIAIRIAKAVRELGHLSVGVWTDSEPNACHLKYCDFWVHLRGSSHAETYLNQEKLIQLAKSHDVDAIHPGYGFLAENAGFARKLKENGITWIGPHADAIEKMGDKSIAKAMAQKSGVPVIPGSVGEVESVEKAIEFAREVGFPILLKATAGGGGKGMRGCYSEDDIKQFYPSVQREALSSFGHDGLLVEKLIEDPHHIEVQVVADKHGQVFHAYERECSIQRRHQKLIEEAPSPFIGDDQKLRQRLCETALLLAKEVDYDSVGTVELIMGSDRQFYFLEMNTRIQVEHPITEQVTGLDLVCLQIQAGLGEKLSIDQSLISLRGHSIECRICAEDPITLMPTPGEVVAIHERFPQGVRFDHCLFAGMQVRPDFDPMVGKLITTARNREECLRKMQTALDGLSIEGLCHNVSFHQLVLKTEEFQKGFYTTLFIEQSKPHEKGFEEKETVPEDELHATALQKLASYVIEERL